MSIESGSEGGKQIRQKITKNTKTKTARLFC